jgi:hypothetical protein
MSSQDNKTFERSRFYTLLAVAYSVAKDLKEGNERIEYYLHLAMEWYREFNFDSAAEVRAVEIPLKSWKQIDFPCDMVDWVRVGFLSGDLIKILTQDAYIIKTHQKVLGVPQENKPIGGTELSSSRPFFIYDGVTGGGQYYGIDAGSNAVGYFDVDWKNRKINFKETVTGLSKIYLEYITDGLECSALTVINPYAFWVGKQWVKWQRVENDDKASESKKERAERQYTKALGKYDTRINHMDVEDVKEAILSGYSLVVQM